MEKSYKMQQIQIFGPIIKWLQLSTQRPTPPSGTFRKTSNTQRARKLAARDGHILWFQKSTKIKFDEGFWPHCEVVAALNTETNATIWHVLGNVVVMTLLRPEVIDSVFIVNNFAACGETRLKSLFISVGYSMF